jgi:hypothetical protein
VDAGSAVSLGEQQQYLKIQKVYVQTKKIKKKTFIFEAEKENKNQKCVVFFLEWN